MECKPSKKVLAFIVLVFITIGLPFILVHHYSLLRYVRYCDDYQHDIIVRDNTVYYEGQVIYTISTFRDVYGTLTINSGTPTIKDEIGETSIKFGNGAPYQIGYKSRTTIPELQKISGEWWRTGIFVFSDNFKTMSNPNNANEVKICTNTFDGMTPIMTSISPILQRAMRKCIACMDPCQSECAERDTRLVTYTYESCDSKNVCTTKIGTRWETRCVRYRSYNECASRCQTPSCSGISL